MNKELILEMISCNRVEIMTNSYLHNAYSQIANCPPEKLDELMSAIIVSYSEQINYMVEAFNTHMKQCTHVTVPMVKY